jgi:hypothetical protein
MITGTLVALALLLGYGFTVASSMVATFGLTSASPGFVAREHRVTAGYKRLQALIWFGCVTLGAFVTGVVAQGTYPLMAGTLLAVALIAVLWLNTWEARQRGMAHQILMSLVTIVGVMAGYRLAGHFLRVYIFGGSRG